MNSENSKEKIIKTVNKMNNNILLDKTKIKYIMIDYMKRKIIKKLSQIKVLIPAFNHPLKK